MPIFFPTPTISALIIRNLTNCSSSKLHYEMVLILLCIVAFFYTIYKFDLVTIFTQKTTLLARLEIKLEFLRITYQVIDEDKWKYICKWFFNVSDVRRIIEYNKYMTIKWIIIWYQFILISFWTYIQIFKR